MKKKRKTRKRLWILILLAIAIFARIFLGTKMGVWFSSAQLYDDALLARYAVNPLFSSENPLSLLKMMGFPMFLRFVHHSPFSYPLMVSLLWVIVALLAKNVMKMIQSKRWMQYFAFFYFLFFPTAFEYLMGTRLYRNSVLAPFYLLVFLLIIKIGAHIIQKKYRTPGFILSNLFLAIVFPWAYFIKEDGLWLLVVLIFFSIIYVLIVLYQVYESGRYHRYFLIPVLCIPLIGFVCVDTLYLNANENLYAVRYIQTRTDGQFGQFVNRVYKIESSHRNGDIWAPYDAIQKAFSASPTLKSNPKLLKKISKSQWVQGDIKKNPIQGDFLTWTLRDALVDAGLWKNQKKTEQFFEKVNRELDDAFQSGKLKKDKRFQIISSAGGRNRQERWELIPLMSKMFRGHIFLNGYRSGGANSEIHSKKLFNKLSTFLHTPYLKDNKINGKKMNYDVANTVTEILFVFYMILNPILFIVSVFSIGLTLMDCIRNRNRLRRSLRKNPNRYYAWIGSLMVLSIAIVYSFSISWFVSFVYNQGNAIQGQYWLNFYGIGLASLLGVFYMFGIRSFDVYVSRIKRTIRKPVKKRA